jgi:hypothetical protein
MTRRLWLVHCHGESARSGPCTATSRAAWSEFPASGREPEVIPDSAGHSKLNRAVGKHPWLAHADHARPAGADRL